MKNRKLSRTFIGLFLAIGFISCNSDDTEMSTIQPSTNLIEMEAEGGESEISFTNGNWTIAEVRNNDGNVHIFGDIYSPNGERIQENKTLTLEDQGKIEALWNDKGFSVTRETSSSLQIKLIENSTGKEFNFSLVLNSGQEFKKINVVQKKSQGYQFKSIEFSLKEEDGDSLFIKKGIINKFNVQQSLDFTFSPYEGLDSNNTSRFESREKDAFVWLKNDSILTQIPTRIENDKIYFNGEKRIYSNVSSIHPNGLEEMKTITIPVGESSFTTEIEYRKRKVSYQLHLINNRTAEEKIIEGKWIEITPTGEYSIEWNE
jgi:hypothetical protein